MGWTEKLVIGYVVSLLGYLVLTTYAIPTYAYGACSFADQIPNDSLIMLSLNQWILGNFISGLPLYTVVCGAIETKACKDCILYMFVALGILYTLFQNVWSIIGFVIFNNSYRNECASAGSFNTFIQAGVFYGIILFPVTSVLAILFAIITCIRSRGRNNQEDVYNLGSPAIEDGRLENTAWPNIQWLYVSYWVIIYHHAFQVGNIAIPQQSTRPTC